MLSRIESRIMEYMFGRCRGKRTVLIDPQDVLNSIVRGSKYEITLKQLETHMKNIVLDGYIDYSLTNNKEGRTIYVVTLTTQGEAFQRQRDDHLKKRLLDLGWKVLLTVVAFTVAFILGRIVR